tara:strand:- start:70 stop:786 length:717 start_codon:yes stop_codon:yes gene_type:complete
MRVEQLGVDSVLICTPAKVASASFLESIMHLFPDNIIHTHSLNILRETVNSKENSLIISGIRNPLDRNISYFFQHFHHDDRVGIRTSSNDYEGEYFNIMSRDELLETNTLDIIDLYFKHQNHYSFNDWFYEFFKIVDIVDTEFDKNSGIKIYSLPNNNYLMLYVFEQLPMCKNFIESFFNIEDFKHINDSSVYIFKHKYKAFKSLVNFDQEYKETLLRTPFMKYFYTDEQIELFFKKY